MKLSILFFSKIIVSISHTTLCSDWIQHDHIFTQKQCGSLGFFEKSLDAKDDDTCKRDCLETTGCNAFNWVVNKHQQGHLCFFFKCSKPIPAPESFNKGDSGWIHAPDIKGNVL